MNYSNIDGKKYLYYGPILYSAHSYIEIHSNSIDELRKIYWRVSYSYKYRNPKITPSKWRKNPKTKLYLESRFDYFRFK